MMATDPSEALRSRFAVPQFAPVPNPVRIAPSRQELRRADPSLSFQVIAEGASGFDVIVAVEPGLFDPDEAHRRTPKNFRSSRQDFQGAPIEVETGFYMLPRAYLREVLTLEPRPTRLHYVAVAYGADGTAMFSVPVERMAVEAPHVTLAGDLHAASLAKVMGMAVERLGALSAAGRVARSSAFAAAGDLPAEIGGLPITRRTAAPGWTGAGNGGSGNGNGNGNGNGKGNGAGHDAADRLAGNGAAGDGWVARPGNGTSGNTGADYSMNGHAERAGGDGHLTAENGGNSYDGNGFAGNGNAGNGYAGNGNGSRGSYREGQEAGSRAGEPRGRSEGNDHHPPPPEAPAVHAMAAGGQGGFIDEDFAGWSGEPAAIGGFRDLDTDRAAPASPGYDDGYGPPPAAGAFSGSFPNEDVAAIPPLDPAPGPSPARAPDLALDVAPGAPPASATDAEPDAAWSGGAAPHNNAAVAGGDRKDRLVQTVIGEGAGGRYDALNLDGAFRGRSGPSHPYFQRAHEGLCFGPHQASQDSGELGELLALMQAGDPAGFDATFGSASAELLAVTTAPGPLALGQPDGRSARVQPVAGADLWEEPWAGRFRSAGRHPPFQAATRAQIIARRLDPILPVAEALGLDHLRGLAMLLSLSVLQGVEAAVATVRNAINPFDTPARLAAVLDALGHPDLADFQRANGLPVADLPDAATHFTLIASLRRIGSDSPVQVPDPETAMDLLVTAVGPGTVGDALLKIRMSAVFSVSAGRE